MPSDGDGRALSGPAPSEQAPHIGCPPAMNPDPALIEHHAALVDRLEPSRVIVFTDIDDTLLQSEPKLPAGETAAIGGLDRSGQALSYITRKQRTLIGLLEAAACAVVPVTGRSRDAFERVCYRFRGYSALSHGAVVLTPAGRLCPRWTEVLADQAGSWSDILARAQRMLAEMIAGRGLDARANLIVDQGIHAYVNVKGTEGALDDLVPTIRAELEGLGLRTHRNGRNVAFLPPYACKRKAVEHIARQLAIGPDDLVIALGDSLSDLPFLRAADFMVVPVESQIDQALGG